MRLITTQTKSKQKEMKQKLKGFILANESSIEYLEYLNKKYRFNKEEYKNLLLLITHLKNINELIKK